MSERIAIIAALHREVAPFLREGHGFTRVAERNGEGHGSREGHGFSRADGAASAVGALAPEVKIYRSADILLVIAGVGRAAAARAAHAAIELHRPTQIVSVGFAGALTPDLRVADIVTPSQVIDAVSGRTFHAVGGTAATLVTASSVVSRDSKSALATRFSAHAVDMEAAAVAEIAENAGLPFAAIKAISDPFDFEMPPLDRFIDSSGKLNLLQLLVYALPRPRVWGALAQLGRHAARAAEALRGPLAEFSAQPSESVK